MQLSRRAKGAARRGEDVGSRRGERQKKVRSALPACPALSPKQSGQKYGQQAVLRFVALNDNEAGKFTSNASLFSSKLPTAERGGRAVTYSYS